MKEKKEAISGTVTGNDQHVGFRAMIMKQAIEYNLAGFAKNLPNDRVNFTLQGDAKRLTDALSAIQEGTKRSSDIKVSTTEGTVDPALNAFTIYAWTSTTRKITNPYDLVFHRRSDDGKLAPADVKTVWHAGHANDSNSPRSWCKHGYALRRRSDARTPRSRSMRFDDDMSAPFG